MLMLNNTDVEQVLTMDLAMQVIEEGYKQFFRGEALCRPRIVMQFPTREEGHTYGWSTTEGGSIVTGYFASRLMSDVSYRTEYNGVETREKFCIRPGLFCGLVFLTSIHTGEPLALMNDGFLQHARQGADGGIGTKYLAREDSEVIGMLGSGGMARSHAAACCVARPIKKMKVFSPTKANREAYAREMEAKLGIEVTVHDNPREVYRDVDILSVCTDSAQPVVVKDWLEPGMHIVDVGGLRGNAMERVDVALRLGISPPPVGFPNVVVGGDALNWVLPSLREQQEHRGERTFGDASTDQADEKMIYLKDLLAGTVQGRTSPEQITYSERGGMRGVEFAAVAGAIYERAREQGLGREIPTEWLVEDIRD
jgi:ornithine cyclodeaminase/alanine dehydrogenase-like protein (mu-crystallin family)